MAHVLFSEINDIRFSLEIVSYEVPEDPRNEYDANWIVIRISVQLGFRNFSKTDPSLLTWEIEDLIQWCRGGYQLEPLLQFVEQSIEFYATPINSDLIHLKVTLSGKLLPEWHDSGSMTLELFIPPEELKKFSVELEAELSKFPYRQTHTE